MEREWKWRDLVNKEVRKGVLKKFGRLYLRFIRMFILLGILMHFFAFGIVPTASMKPNFQEEDFILFNKTQDVTYGDVIFFEPPGTDGEVYLKRVIAKGGDSVKIQEGKVYVNGKVIEEPYIEESPRYSQEKWVVPDRKLYVLGDNRNHSSDSHVWGFVPVENVKGKAIAVILPWKRFSLLFLS